MRRDDVGLEWLTDIPIKSLIHRAGWKIGRAELRWTETASPSSYTKLGLDAHPWVDEPHGRRVDDVAPDNLANRLIAQATSTQLSR